MFVARANLHCLANLRRASRGTGLLGLGRQYIGESLPWNGQAPPRGTTRVAVASPVTPLFKNPKTATQSQGIPI